MYQGFLIRLSGAVYAQTVAMDTQCGTTVLATLVLDEGVIDKPPREPRHGDRYSLSR